MAVERCSSKCPLLHFILCFVASDYCHLGAHAGHFPSFMPRSGSFRLFLLIPSGKNDRRYSPPPYSVDFPFASLFLIAAVCMTHAGAISLVQCRPSPCGKIRGHVLEATCHLSRIEG